MQDRKKVLVVYATRKFDSNLFMSSTIFSGLQKAGYDVSAVFCGTKESCEIFAERCSCYFSSVKYYVERATVVERLVSSPLMALVTKPVKICDQSWIAAKATVLPGVTIGEGAVVGACAVVAKDVKPWSIAVGNPARGVGSRTLK